MSLDYNTAAFGGRLVKYVALIFSLFFHLTDYLDDCPKIVFLLFLWVSRQPLSAEMYGSDVVPLL